MTKKLALLLIYLIILATPLFAKELLPEYSGYVNDFAKVIDNSYAAKINAVIEAIEKKTSVQVAIVTIGSILPYDEITYTNMLFDKWKIGKEKKDNGLLLLLVINERRTRIQTGYGLEGILPDGLCGEILDKNAIGYFKSGNFQEGLYRTVCAIDEILAKHYNVSPEESIGKDLYKNHNSLVVLVYMFLFFGYVGYALLGSYVSRKKKNTFGYDQYNNSYWGHGSFGGGGFSGGFGGFGGGMSGGGGSSRGF